ncbi:hypothetical protein Barb6_02243 [Bacteroidales bacterium Barb6]|nr:hypothetical protein Barb6_02243 [Bacteroidales bacterium Barb6]
MLLNNVTQIALKGQEISAPHAAERNVGECGVHGDAGKEVQKGRPNNLCGKSFIIICSLYRPFRALLVCIYLNLTFPNVPLRFTLG